MNCLICESDKKEIIRDHVRYGIKLPVAKCRDCGFVYLEKKLEDDVAYYQDDEYRKLYSPVYGEYAPPEKHFEINSPLQEKRLTHFLPYIDKDTNLLDLGCAVGSFLYHVRDKVKTATGIEINKSHAEFARKKLGIPVYEDKIENFKNPGEPFDVISAFAVLEHIKDARAFLRGARKQLKDGGIFYIEVPNIRDPYLEIFDLPGYKEFYYREPHLYYFSEEHLKKLLESEGFAVETQTYQSYNILNALSWVLADKPQKTPTSGQSEPKALGQDTPALAEFNAILKDADNKYHELVDKYRYSDTLIAIARKK